MKKLLEIKTFDSLSLTNLAVILMNLTAGTSKRELKVVKEKPMIITTEVSEKTSNRFCSHINDCGGIRDCYSDCDKSYAQEEDENLHLKARNAMWLIVEIARFE
ncbi:MAG: hypothetical protein QW724_04955 [Nitrososphaerota archaeon]